MFAAGGGSTYRIDRHPTMSVHPVTPMCEADLTLHLAKQTTRKIELLDVLALSGQDAAVRLRNLRANTKAEVVLFDGFDRTTLLNTGRLLWGERPAECSFAVGSSGLIQALVEHWRESGDVPASWHVEAPHPIDRLIVVSGSCSPVTGAQIRWAIANGFADVAIDPANFDHTTVVRAALAALDQGQSVVLYTALGSANRPSGEGGEKLGTRLGVLLRELLKRSEVRRAVVAGGDTSSHAVRQLGIEALTFARITTPGAPLCRVHAPGEMLDGLELVLKGGQVGPENFFEVVKKGKG
jgi:3-oxoisoapionate kinase